MYNSPPSSFPMLVVYRIERADKKHIACVSMFNKYLTSIYNLKN